MSQEVMNELMLSNEIEYATQAHFLKVKKTQFLRDQNSQQEFFSHKTSLNQCSRS